MIIKTSRAPVGTFIDTLLTGLGWAALIYLVVRSIQWTVDYASASPQGLLDAALAPTVYALLAYAGIAAFNALLVILWGHYRGFFGDKLQHRTIAPAANEEMRAHHFRLSSSQLHEVQDSRVTVIYHSGDGNIAFLETDQLQMQPAGNTGVYEDQKVA